MHAVHIRLIGKRVVDFLLVLIELFSLLSVTTETSENRLKICVFQGGQFWANFRVIWDVPREPFFCMPVNALQLCR